MSEKAELIEWLMAKAQSIADASPFSCLVCGAGLPNPDCGHRKNGVRSACVPATTDLAEALGVFGLAVYRKAYANGLAANADTIASLRRELAALKAPVGEEIEKRAVEVFDATYEADIAMGAPMFSDNREETMRAVLAAVAPLIRAGADDGA